MRGLIAVVLSSTVAIGQSATLPMSDQDLHPALEVAPLPALPPLPKGRSTVMGGEIRNFDPVRDQFTLKVFGGHSLTILFDERTQIYRDGIKISVLELRQEDHASVETTLDGAKIFALRVHLLSHLPEGECIGHILSYHSKTENLVIGITGSHDPITLQFPSGTEVAPLERKGLPPPQSGSLDLISGSLVKVRFKAGEDGQRVVTRIEILAVPRSTFTFTGNLTFLDLHSGRFAIVDRRDGETRQILYDPKRISLSRDLHEGSAVEVTTSFDGERYVATEITPK